MAAALDIEIEQGATFQKSLVWKDSTGTPINLTGYTARMMVRLKISDAAPLLTFTTENGGIALGGALGTIDITGLATLTDAIQTTKVLVGVYDLELVSPTGVVTRLIEGAAVIIPQVTR